MDNLNCKIYYGDITKKESLSSVFENIDGKEVYVIHCAGVVYIKSKYNPIVYDVNVNGTKKYCRQSSRNRCKTYLCK